MGQKITTLDRLKMLLRILTDSDFRKSWHAVKKSDAYRKHPRASWRPVVFEQFDADEYSRRYEADCGGSKVFFRLLIESSYAPTEPGNVIASAIDAVLNERYEVVSASKSLGVS